MRMDVIATSAIPAEVDIPHVVDAAISFLDFLEKSSEGSNRAHCQSGCKSNSSFRVGFCWNWVLTCCSK